MLLDLIDREKLRRCLLYFGYMLAVLLFQNMLFSRIQPLGVKALFVPAAVVAVGMFEGGVWGAVFGLFIGYFADIGFNNSVLFLALFPVVGFFSGVFSRWFVNKRFFAFMIICVAALLFVTFFQMFRLLIFMGQDPGALFKTALIQIIWSLPLSAPLYFPVKTISRKKI